MKFFKIFSNPLLYLSLIVIVGFIVRIYKIDSPIADWHSWRQADTAAVTRSFINEGFNPLYPKYDDMSGAAERPMPNLGRYRFVEFPIYNIVVYPFYKLFGVNVVYDRFVSILFSLGSIVFVYLITKRYKDSYTALIAAFIFSILPFNVFFSRTTLPEPTFVFFALGMVYFVDRWISENKRKWLILGFFFAVTTFLLKPWGIFFALPLIYLMQQKEKSFNFLKVRFIVFWVLAFLPFFLWRVWIDQFPEGIPASSWLFNSDGIRFRPAFWWWLVQSRIGGEILAVPGTVLFMIGVMVRPKSREAPYFLHFFLLSILLYFVIFATGNVRHNYYQILFVPIACIFTAFGISSLLRGINSFIPRIWTILLVLLLVPLMFYFGWVSVKGFYQINNYPIVEAGLEADKILPKNARVIAPYNGDTAFLYQINRAGWPFTPLPVKDLISRYGATHFVSVAKDAKTKWVMRYFKVIEEKPNYVIIDLTKLTKDFDPGDVEP